MVFSNRGTGKFLMVKQRREACEQQGYTTYTKTDNEDELSLGCPAMPPQAKVPPAPPEENPKPLWPTRHVEAWRVVMLVA